MQPRLTWYPQSYCFNLQGVGIPCKHHCAHLNHLCVWMLGKIHRGDRHTQGAITKAQKQRHIQGAITKAPKQRYFICNNQQYSVWNSFSLNEPNPSQLGVVKTEPVLANPTDIVREVRCRKYFTLRHGASLPHSRFAWLSLSCFGELCSSASVFLPSELLQLCVGGSSSLLDAPLHGNAPSLLVNFQGCLEAKETQPQTLPLYFWKKPKWWIFVQIFHTEPLKFVFRCLASASR